MKKVVNVRSDIVKRHTRTDGIILRELSCGHFELERSGGKAREALWAYCPGCTEQKAFDAAVKASISSAFRPHPPEPVEGA